MLRDVNSAALTQQEICLKLLPQFVILHFPRSQRSNIVSLALLLSLLSRHSNKCVYDESFIRVALMNRAELPANLRRSIQLWGERSRRAIDRSMKRPRDCRRRFPRKMRERISSITIYALQGMRAHKCSLQGRTYSLKLDVMRFPGHSCSHVAGFNYQFP